MSPPTKATQLALIIGDSLALGFATQEIRRAFAGVAPVHGFGHGGNGMQHFVVDGAEVTATKSCAITQGSAIVTMASTVGLFYSQGIVSPSFPWGTQIYSVDSINQVTLTQPATDGVDGNIVFSNVASDLDALQGATCDELLLLGSLGVNDSDDFAKLVNWESNLDALMDIYRRGAGASRVFCALSLPYVDPLHASYHFFAPDQPGYNLRRLMLVKAARPGSRFAVYNGDHLTRTDHVHLANQVPENAEFADGLSAAMLGLLYPTPTSSVNLVAAINTERSLEATQQNKTLGAGCVVPVVIQRKVSDETTPVTAGANKFKFRMPHAMTLTGVRLSLSTAPTGAAFVVDLNESGNTVLSTKLSVDAGEKTSTTAATAAVITDASLADDAEMSVDFDQVGSVIAGAGVEITLLGTRTL